MKKEPMVKIHFFNLNIQQIRSHTLSFLQTLRLKLVGAKPLDIWKLNRTSMPDVVTGEYLINRTLTRRDYHHIVVIIIILFICHRLSSYHRVYRHMKALPGNKWIIANKIKTNS
jgi:hypothetical protein